MGTADSIMMLKSYRRPQYQRPETCEIPWKLAREYTGLGSEHRLQGLRD